MTETTETNATPTNSVSWKSTKIAIVKDDNHYQTLAETFMKDAKISDVDPMEKKKFFAICAVNKLNPFKNEIYAIPRNLKQKDWTWKKSITVVVDYHQFIKKAEESKRLDGWNIQLKKDANGKITGWKISIYRKDWHEPFVYEADNADFITYYTKDWEKKLENPLWETRTELMIRKQLIRVGFSLCFPDNCATLDNANDEIDSMKVEQAEIVASEIPSITEEKSEWTEAPKTDQKEVTGELIDDINEKIQAISNDQIRIIKELGEKYFPGEDIQSPETYESGNEMILKMKIEIGRKFIKDRSIMMTEEEVKNLFWGDQKEIKAIRREALKILSI